MANKVSGFPEGSIPLSSTFLKSSWPADAKGEQLYNKVLDAVQKIPPKDLQMLKGNVDLTEAVRLLSVLSQINRHIESRQQQYTRFESPYREVIETYREPVGREPARTAPQPMPEEARPSPPARAAEEPRPSPSQEPPPRGSEEPKPSQPSAVPPRGSNAQPQLQSQAGNAGPSLAQPPPRARSSGSTPPPLSGKGSEGTASPSASGALPLRSTAAGEGQTFREFGISGNRKSLAYQQVILASLLFGPEGGEKEKAASGSLSRISLFLQQLKSLDEGFAKLWIQIGQGAEGGMSLSATQQKELATALNALIKQFEALQKQASEILPQAAGDQKEEPLPKDPLKAVPQLKAKCDLLLSQIQSQLEGKLAALADQINLKYSAQGALPPATSEKGAALKAAQTPPSESESSAGVAPTGGQAEKAGKTTAPPPPSTSASESAAQAGMEAKAAAKSLTQLPQLIQSSIDLQAFTDKLQKKELAAPFNIALIYPLDRKEQSQTIKGVKTDSKEEKEGQKKDSWGSGGGHCQEMVLIPAGPAIVEGPFSKDNELHSQIVELNDFLMAIYPVTNEQYADWLNEALDAKTIKIDEKGVVRDQHRNMFCLTHWAASTSQIQTEVSKGQLVFRPLRGTERHPVVQVSWLGSEAYCRDNQFRLPSEAEWEKAAGMPILREGEPLAKFRYGFGKDEVDLSWANYRDELREYENNRTLPVGFYNGEAVFTKGGKNYQSRHARSPYGCYDMSGNVRQWTSDGPEGKKAAKGGSYNSPPSELRVSARSLFDPHSCLPDTGFRVVFDLI